MSDEKETTLLTLRKSIRDFNGYESQRKEIIKLVNRVGTKAAVDEARAAAKERMNDMLDLVIDLRMLEAGIDSSHIFDEDKE